MRDGAADAQPRKRWLLDGTLHVVIYPRLGDLPGPAALIHSDARLMRQVDASPPDGVELESAADAVLGHSAVLQDDPAPGAEEACVELGEVGRATDAVLRTGRLAEAALGLECRDTARRVTRCERRLVRANDVAFAG